MEKKEQLPPRLIKKYKGAGLGIIGRGDNTGLGIETWEMAKNFPEAKVLLVDFSGQPRMDRQIYKLFPQRFHRPIIISGAPTDADLKDFFTGLSLIFTIETPYNSNLYRLARERGIKSVLRVNYEWLENFADPPDYYIAPSLWYYKNIPKPKSYIPFPVNTDLIKFKKRVFAKRFLHIAGNRKAAYDRNGTELLIKAIPLIKAKEIEIIIRSQVPIPEVINDRRVTVLAGDVENYWEIWDTKADVLVLPRRYAGQSLPINEAMAAGLAIVSSDMGPQNEFLPTDLLVPVENFDEIMIKNPIEIANIRPETLAAKIDEIAHKDIRAYSEASGRIAEEWSWKSLSFKYKNLFTNLCPHFISPLRTK